ncbi:MAG: glycosyltransferase family 39 protein [Planctomycetaceae bacterium]|nr:glycosyltransferase family 39 protein [Planctomycetaceae bacterium]
MKNIPQERLLYFHTIMNHTSKPDFFSGTSRSGRVLLFGSAVFLHAALWTFLPPRFLANYPIDTMEMMVIGQNRVISTFKHPAFQSWIVEIGSLLFRNAEFVPYLAAQTACLLTVFTVWRLARKILPPRPALLAALTLLSYFYFHYDSTVYNNRTFMRFFWILAVYFFYRALEKNKLRHWILAGAALGAGIYCKFTIFVLVAAILIFMCLEPRAGKYWKTPGPYLSAGVCFLIFLPLLVWLIRNHFPMLGYTLHSIGKPRPGLADHFLSPIRFLANQIPILLILLIPLFPVLGFRWKFDTATLFRTFDGRFLCAFLGIPLGLQLLVAAGCAGNMRTALGCHLWLILPLLLLYGLKIPAAKERFYARSMKIVFADIFLFLVITVLVTQLAPVLTKKDSRYHFPGRELAQKVNALWSERYRTPLPFVRGDDWPAESVCVYLRPHVKTNVYSDLWSDEEEFRVRGGILLWMSADPGHAPRHSVTGCFGNKDFRYSPETGQPDEWLKKFPDAEILPPLELSPRTLVRVPPVKIGVAVVPPKYVP